jgi:CIC family chloride channel protein
LLTSYDILFYFILGLLAAVVGWLFIKVLYKSEDIFDAIKIPAYIKPAIGGLILGLIGLYFPQIFGVGYPSIEQTLNGQLGPTLVFGLIALKIIATSITLGSGGSGGVFAPSLFIGAMLGSSFGSFLHFVFPGISISPGAYAMVGMAAVFAGAAQAPISAILILFEMTGDYKIILPLMVACVISTLVLKWISKDSIYTLKLSRRGIDILAIRNEDLMDKITVSEVMFKNVITVSETASVSEAGLLIKSTTHRGFPVLDNLGRLKGIITHHDINGALANGNGDKPVSQIMTTDLVFCFPEETLRNAFQKMGDRNIGRIPVVEHDNPEHLIGLITRKGIISHYNLRQQKKVQKD